jgi:hypothetical protein
MIAASMMLNRPIILHHKRSRLPFDPHLMSWVVDASIEMAKHGIRFIDCQLVNPFALPASTIASLLKTGKKCWATASQKDYPHQ